MIEVELPHYSKKEDGNPVLTKKTAIVLHDTMGKTAKSALEWGLNPESKVSWHYLIDKNGEVYHCIPDEYVAWHAGRGSLFGEDDVNSFSFGIEIVDNDDKDSYPDPQLEALINLCVELCARENIPLNRVVGHQHVAPGRKTDPGKDFPWYEFLIVVGTTLSEREFTEDETSNDQSH